MPTDQEHFGRLDRPLISALPGDQMDRQIMPGADPACGHDAVAFRLQTKNGLVAKCDLGIVALEHVSIGPMGRRPMPIQEAGFRDQESPGTNRADERPISMESLQPGHLSRVAARGHIRSEEHTSELQSLMRISYAVFCLKKKTHDNQTST